MPSLLWPRDLESDADNVRNTFSSWDACMAESYCKWPVIIAIIIGSLIAISIIWCCARCLCCGLECCCGICSCFNRCCPSPRRSNQGYEKPQAYPYNSQYQSPAPPMYGGAGGGYRGAQTTARFDAPSNKKYNEDALPAMPSWSDATSRQVEQRDHDDDVAMEMEKLYPSSSTGRQQQGLLHQRNESADSTEYGDIGNMPPSPYHEHSHNPSPELAAGGFYPPAQAATPYHDQATPYQNQAHSPYQTQAAATASSYQPQPASHEYSQHQQFVPSPTSTAAPSVYPPTYHTRPPSSVYTSPYNAPPSYATAPPSIASPQQHVRMPSYEPYAVGRKPTPGSWRDV